jgi:hypothetical protein
VVDTAEKGQPFAKGLVKIRNDGKVPDKIISVSAEFAAQESLGTPFPILLPPTGHTVAVPLIFANIDRKLSEKKSYAGELTFQKAGLSGLNWS